MPSNFPVLSDENNMNRNPYKLEIVILNYRVTDVTLDCLHSLSQCKDLEKISVRVTVWENGSGEAAVMRLRESINEHHWGAWVELRVSEKNLGFTGGNNRVIERIMRNSDAADYILLLNSDTLVNDGALLSLVDFMEQHSRVGIAGSRLLTLDGEQQCSPFRFPGIASEFDQGLKLGVVSRLLSRWRVPMPPPDQASPVDWVSGASMLLRREMLEQTGLLDESYFTYFEDLDLCKRAHQNAWGVWYVPQSQVIHLEGVSSGISNAGRKRRPAFWFQARRRYFLKHQGVIRTVLIDFSFIMGFSIWRIRQLLQNKPDDEPSGMLVDFIRHSVFVNGFKLPVVHPPEMNHSGQR